MRLAFAAAVVLIGLGPGGALGASTTGAVQFRAGAATSNITPELGGPIAGGFSPPPAVAVHDELHARCLVLDDGRTKLALVVCDLIGIHHSMSREARRRIQEHTGIPPEHVLISATHTHSAVSTMGPRYDLDAPLDAYQEFVVRRIVDGVRRAAGLLRPAEIAFGRAEAPEYSFNRRWLMKPGPMTANPFGGIDRVRSSPPFNDVGLIAQAGPIDSTISFLALREPEGPLIAVFSAYAMHYVGRGVTGHISADYHGLYCEALRRLQADEDPDRPFVAIMASGTSADKTVTDRSKPSPPAEPWLFMRQVAEELAGKVQAALAGVTWKDRATLAALYREEPIAWRKVDEKLLAWARQVESMSAPTAQQRYYGARLQELARLDQPARVPLQVLRIGDTAIATTPCETFAEIGLDYKRRSPLRQSFMVSLNHGYLGYLPTPRHFELGGYETWPPTNTLEPQASEKMLDALLAMTGELAARKQ